MDYAVAEEISALLEGAYSIKVVESAVSTNTSLKDMANQGAPGGTVLIAHSQNGGRGRMGRSFLSERGGLYMSLLLRPKVSPATACLYTPITALAVAEAIEAVLGQRTLIKWVNDLFYRGKKVCGILTEASINKSGTGVDYVVIGIGLNVYSPKNGFSKELQEIATSLLPTATAKNGIIDRLAAEITERVFAYTENAQSHDLLDAYKGRLFILGERVTVHRAGEQFEATVIDLNEDYTLAVRDDNGKLHTLLSGEVSIRPKQYE